MPDVIDVTSKEQVDGLTKEAFAAYKQGLTAFGRPEVTSAPKESELDPDPIVVDDGLSGDGQNKIQIEAEKPTNQTENQVKTPPVELTQTELEIQTKIESLEKQAKDHQSSYTKTAQENRALQNQLQIYKNMLNQFKHRIEHDGFGNPVKWNFDDVDKETDKNPEPIANDDPLWDEKPAEAAQKKIDYEMYMFRQTQTKQTEDTRTKNEANAKAVDFQTKFDKSMANAAVLFSDLNDTNSRLFQLAEQNMTTNALFGSHNGPLIATQMAAAELGILPQAAQEKLKTVPKKKQKDKTYLTELGKPGARGAPTVTKGVQRVLDWRASQKSQFAS